MNTKYLMISTSILLGALGIVLSFLPDEIIQLLGSNPDRVILLVLQLTGALYIGFALMNWMARRNIIGGIYSRPLVVGNFAHFFVGGMALIKFVLTGQALAILWGLAGIYIIFAICFGLVMFRHPTKKV